MPTGKLSMVPAEGTNDLEELLSLLDQMAAVWNDHELGAGIVRAISSESSNGVQKSLPAQSPSGTPFAPRVHDR